MKYDRLLICSLGILLAGCVSQITERERKTIYVAKNHIVYGDQRFRDFSELKNVLDCDKAEEVFISPLVNTPSERFSKATADFMMMCGEPKVIKIQLTE